MQTLTPDTAMTAEKEAKSIILELSVKNHPGVMSHICGLFSRRAYNLEKILCFPRPDTAESRMWLQVNEENRLEQVIKQIEKLEDVEHVQYHANNGDFFTVLEAIINSEQ